MGKTRLLAFLGIFLLICFFAQYFLGISWNWLEEKQEMQMYRRWSGLVLATFIAFQWILTLTRIVRRLQSYAIGLKSIHNFLGIISPLLFYIHSTALGFGYLLILTVLFFANMLLGTLNLDVIKKSNPWLFQGWMISHVMFSLAITFLMLFHIGVVFYYK